MVSEPIKSNHQLVFDGRLGISRLVLEDRIFLDFVEDKHEALVINSYLGKIALSFGDARKSLFK